MRLLNTAVLSLADMAVPGRLAAIGRVLDAAEDLRPERMDDRDPPRRRIESAEQALAGLEAELQAEGALYLGYLRIEPRVIGEIDITGEGANEDPPYPNEISFSVDDEWLRNEAHRECVASALRGLAEATDAYIGHARFELPYYKQVVPMINAPLLKAGLDTPTWAKGEAAERELDHIHWLNYFGPSFVQHWGRDRLEGLGIRQDWTANGGVVIWATETPFVHDRKVKRTTNYAFKQPFFERVGANTFVHEGYEPGAPGQYVPTFADHRRHAGRLLG